MYPCELAYTHAHLYLYGNLYIHYTDRYVHIRVQAYKYKLSAHHNIDGSQAQEHVSGLLILLKLSLKLALFFLPERSETDTQADFENLCKPPKPSGSALWTFTGYDYGSPAVECYCHRLAPLGPEAAILQAKCCSIMGFSETHQVLKPLWDAATRHTNGTSKGQSP